MIDVTPLEDLGHANHVWLDARHHFSFANYYDPARMGFGKLRVWNDDLIKAGKGFPMHPHNDMEIISIINSGSLTHEDNMGNQGTISAGDVQVMTAGTGVVHSEYNRSDEDVRLFQIWIETDAKGHEPYWENREIPKEPTTDKLPVMASGRKGHEHALPIHQDAAIYAGMVLAGNKVSHELEGGRRAYIVPASGEIEINGISIPTRAGVAINEEIQITMLAKTDAKIVMVDLP
jgi:quercetin 2,3-dioxygenase